MGLQKSQTQPSNKTTILLVYQLHFPVLENHLMWVCPSRALPSVPELYALRVLPVCAAWLWLMWLDNHRGCACRQSWLLILLAVRLFLMWRLPVTVGRASWGFQGVLGWVPAAHLWLCVVLLIAGCLRPVSGLVPAGWWAASPRQEEARGKTPIWYLSAPVFLWGSKIPKMASPLSMSPGQMLAASWRLSKISRWVWSRLYSNYCLCTGSWGVRFCPSRVESLFPTAFWLLNQPLAFKARSSGDLSSQCRIFGWGTSTPHSLGKTSAGVIILLYGSHPPGVWVLTVPWIHPSYVPLSGSLFISLVVGDLFC